MKVYPWIPYKNLQYFSEVLENAISLIMTCLHHNFRRVSTTYHWVKVIWKLLTNESITVKINWASVILSVIVYSPLELQPAITWALMLWFI